MCLAALKLQVPTCWKPYFSRQRICLGVVNPLIPALVQPVQQQGCFAADSTASGQMPCFSSAAVCSALGPASHPRRAHNRPGLRPGCSFRIAARSTRRARLRRCSSSCLARTSSRRATTSLTGLPGGFPPRPPGRRRRRVMVICWATAWFLTTRSAGRRKLVAVGQPKEIQEQQVLCLRAGGCRGPPSGCTGCAPWWGAAPQRSPRTGQSQRSAACCTARCRFRRQNLPGLWARSVLWPLTSALESVVLRFRVSRNFWLVLISGRKTTVLRPHGSAPSRRQSGPDKGPGHCPARGIVPAGHAHGGDVQRGMVCAIMRHRKPSRMASVSLYS